jgi:hypothetical protein
MPTIYWALYLELAEEWLALAGRYKGHVPSAVILMANFWHSLAYEAAGLREQRSALPDSTAR